MKALPRLLLVFGALAAAAAAAPARVVERPSDLLIEVNLADFSLTALDLRDGSPGPRFSVVLGSPGHPTPPGDFPIYQVVHNPGWRPGPTARSRGAIDATPSSAGPMGVAKFPFAPGGFALHGGAHPLLLGKPISLGCIRARDEDLGDLIAWLTDRGALASRDVPSGEELRQALRVALRIRIR